jgi:hypothetical protein
VAAVTVFRVFVVVGVVVIFSEVVIEFNSIGNTVTVDIRPKRFVVQVEPVVDNDDVITCAVKVRECGVRLQVRNANDVEGLGCQISALLQLLEAACVTPPP